MLTAEFVPSQNILSKILVYLQQNILRFRGNLGEADVTPLFSRAFLHVERRRYRRQVEGDMSPVQAIHESMKMTPKK